MWLQLQYEAILSRAAVCVVTMHGVLQNTPLALLHPIFARFLDIQAGLEGKPADKDCLLAMGPQKCLFLVASAAQMRNNEAAKPSPIGNVTII